LELFAVKQLPRAAAGRACALAQIVGGKALFKVGRPADIGARPALAVRAEEIDEAGHGANLGAVPYRFPTPLRQGRRSWAAALPRPGGCRPPPAADCGSDARIRSRPRP